MTDIPAPNSEDNSPKRCVEYANELIDLCELSFPKIISIQDINSNFFVALFECITGHTVPDLLLGDDSTTDAHNVQAVIDTLSLDLLGLSLSHISGEDVISGNVISIINLLEVLEAVFVHLPPKIKGNEKKAHEENSQLASSPEKIASGPSCYKLSTVGEQNIPPATICKRKTCRTTLRNSHQHVPKKRVDQATSSHSKKNTDTTAISKPILKRRSSRPVTTTFKRPYIEGIEELHESNFEKKVRLLLQSDKSPVLHVQQMRANYIRSLKTPLKRTFIAPCKKSYLLPHNLRNKAKSPIQQLLTRRRTSRRKITKPPITESKKNEEEDEIPPAIQCVLKEFPGFQFHDNTLELLKRQYYQHVSSIHKQLKQILLKKPTKIIQTEKAIEEEAKLSKILTKELQEKEHLRELHEHKTLENRIKSSLRDARIQSVKMKQYFEEFQKCMTRKLQKRNFSEEVLIEKSFKEILALQKEKMRLLCEKVKETDEYDAKEHRQYLNALKNVYQEQLNLLTESVNTEQKESSEQMKAQKLAAEKLNQEILTTLQKEVRSLQKDVLEMLEDIHFRELDAQNLISSQLQSS